MKLVYFTALLIGNAIGTLALYNGEMTIDRFFAGAFFGLTFIYFLGIGEPK